MASRKPPAPPSAEDVAKAHWDGIAAKAKAEQDAAPFVDYQRRLRENEWTARVYYAENADRIESSRGAIAAAAAPTQTRAQREAEQVARAESRRDDIQAINAFRDYAELKKSNPVRAARMLNDDTGTIERGRALASETPDPPEAA